MMAGVFIFGLAVILLADPGNVADFWRRECPIRWRVAFIVATPFVLLALTLAMPPFWLSAQIESLYRYGRRYFTRSRPIPPPGQP